MNAGFNEENDIKLEDDSIANDNNQIKRFDEDDSTKSLGLRKSISDSYL